MKEKRQIELPIIILIMVSFLSELKYTEFKTYYNITTPLEREKERKRQTDKQIQK
jgi:hypothetical protein